MDGRSSFLGRNEHVSEMSFFYSLMNDTNHRVHSPWEANFFYVPTFNFGISYWFGGELIVGRFSVLAEWLKRNTLSSPFWSSKKSVTAFWASGDLGSCVVEDPSLWDIVIITEYGHTNYSQRELTNERYRNTYCMRSLRGITVPTSNELKDCDDVIEKTSTSIHERTNLLTFLGNKEPRDDVYGQGVRWRSYEALKNVSSVVFNVGIFGEDYFETLRKSVFCLAPSGHGHGNRLTFAMWSGCIPVIIQDGIRQSFDDILPYWDFSLRVPQSEIPNLPAILDAVSAQKREAMHHAVHHNSKFFCWNTRDGNETASARAYEGVLESMRRKVYQESFEF
jgi:hypothetical protein